jgi:hypothetical protein
MVFIKKKKKKLKIEESIPIDVLNRQLYKNTRLFSKFLYCQQNIIENTYFFFLLFFFYEKIKNICSCENKFFKIKIVKIFPMINNVEGKLRELAMLLIKKVDVRKNLNLNT